jgi:hypothetical protein
MLQNRSINGTSALWLATLRRYFAVFAGVNLIWEIAQAPLYTVWVNGTPEWIAFSILHCTAGDIVIGAAVLLAALVCAGNGWPHSRIVYGRVAALTVILGVTYTIYSEYLNVEVHRVWEYRELMPRVPPFGTGLLPLIQWLIVPMISFWGARRTA